MVVHFVGMCQQIPANTEVNRQAVVDAPIVLYEDSVFLSDIGEVAGLRANLVVIHAAG